ncbi:MAG: hypothetical protein K2P87_08870 [Lachnospiraceae bacterium]|nr:hypothetical protein [Lachnospiraceae bacterium]
MTLIQERIITLAIVILAGIVSGRLAVRAVLNLLVGGSMFGGIFYEKEKRKEEGKSYVGISLCRNICCCFCRIRCL